MCLELSNVSLTHTRIRGRVLRLFHNNGNMHINTKEDKMEYVRKSIY